MAPDWASVIRRLSAEAFRLPRPRSPRPPALAFSRRAAFRPTCYERIDDKIRCVGTKTPTRKAWYRDFGLDKPLGALAQLGERRLCKPEVTGSIPVRSTREEAAKYLFFCWLGWQRSRTCRSQPPKSACDRSPTLKAPDLDRADRRASRRVRQETPLTNPELVEQDLPGWVVLPVAHTLRR